MLAIKGVIKNVYAKEAYTNTTTGETTPPKFYAQFESADPKTGKLELLDVRVQDFNEAKANEGKKVAVEVACYPWVNTQTKQAAVSYVQVKGSSMRVATASAAK